MNTNSPCNLMRYIFILFLFMHAGFAYCQNLEENEPPLKNRFKYLEPKFHFGSFIKSNDKLSNSGLLDNGYGGVTLKLGWQPTDPEGWAARYGYPSYGVGFYSGFLSDAEVFGNPNALFGFIKFPVSKSSRRNVFSIEPSLGITYKLNPYHSQTNPVNTAIGARAAVYFNLDLGFAYKWTREMDLLYGFDFSHFSNGSIYQPNSGLNLFGLNVGLRYNYNATQRAFNKDIYSNNVLSSRFRRPVAQPARRERKKEIAIYIAGGAAQSYSMAGSDVLLGTFSGILDYEYQLTEKHAVTGGLDLFYDNRLQNRKPSDRWMTGAHLGYDYRFYRFAVKMQIGKYIGDDKGKGSFFMRPALRYNISNRFFAQVGLKTLDGGAADYIESGFGFKPFSW